MGTVVMYCCNLQYNMCLAASLVPDLRFEYAIAHLAAGMGIYLAGCVNSDRARISFLVTYGFGVSRGYRASPSDRPARMRCVAIGSRERKSCGLTPYICKNSTTLDTTTIRRLLFDTTAEYDLQHQASDSDVQNRILRFEFR